MKTPDSENNSLNQAQAGQPNRGESADSPIVIPVIEEQVQIGKKTIESGRVRISKSVTEHQETVNISLNHEQVNVERKEINQYVESAPEIRQEGDTTIIPVLREEVVVQKRLLLVEELHISKKNVQTEEQQQITLRKEEVRIERDQDPTKSG